MSWGTPSRFDQCSAFSNGIFGFGLIGNDLSTITIVGPSGDDNGALIGVRSGYGRPGGGTVTVVGAKSKSGKLTPFRKQKLFDGSRRRELDHYRSVGPCDRQPGVCDRGGLPDLQRAVGCERHLS